MDSHPDWKPLSDAWLFAIIQQGGPTEALVERLCHEGWFPPEFYARTSRQAERAEVRRRINTAKDDRGLPLFFHMTDALADDLRNGYQHRDVLRRDEGKLRQVRAYHYRDARHKAKVGDAMTRQINATFGRQLPLFPEWNAAHDRLEGECVDDSEAPSP